MASEVSIVNRALTKLGAAPVLALTDPSEQARVMKMMYADVRDAEISRARWKFSLKRALLSPLVAAPVFGYSFQYPLPADYLGLVQVGEIYVRVRGKATWSVEGGNLLTNEQAPLKLRYKSRVTNPAMYHPLFVEALACKLAIEACEKLTTSNTKKQTAWDEYKYALSQAKLQDAIESPPDELPEGSWLGARGYNTDGVTEAHGWAAYPGAV